MRERLFTPNGEQIESIRICGGGLTADFLTFGAVLQNLRLDGVAHPLVLGFSDPRRYLDTPLYLGATVGRFANRIAHGKFSIGDQSFQLEPNEPSGHHLHGGAAGISHRNWAILDHGVSHVQMQIIDPNGQSGCEGKGYPGNCTITATFRLLDHGCLDITYECRTDQPTIANIAHHSYFNLDGSRTILDHELAIDAADYLPVDEVNIPLGGKEPVVGTAFDFLKMRPIKNSDGYDQYDHNFCLSAARVEMRKVAEARGVSSGISMEVKTTEPGVQLFTAAGIDALDGGLDHQYLGSHAGFCLETQIWPDAPNHSSFPAAILMPDEARVQRTQYQFFKNHTA